MNKIENNENYRLWLEAIHLHWVIQDLLKAEEATNGNATRLRWRLLEAVENSEKRVLRRHSLLVSSIREARCLA